MRSTELDRHPHGCFYGGPDDETYWFAADGCPLAHDDGDIETIWSTVSGVQNAYEHLQQAGLLRTGESG